MDEDAVVDDEADEDAAEASGHDVHVPQEEAAGGESEEGDEDEGCGDEEERAERAVEEPEDEGGEGDGAETGADHVRLHDASGF